MLAAWISGLGMADMRGFWMWAWYGALIGLGAAILRVVPHPPLPLSWLLS